MAPAALTSVLEEAISRLGSFSEQQLGSLVSMLAKSPPNNVFTGHKAAIERLLASAASEAAARRPRAFAPQHLANLLYGLAAAEGRSSEHRALFDAAAMHLVPWLARGTPIAPRDSAIIGAALLAAVADIPL